MPSCLHSRRGAALPMAILWSMLLTVGLVAGLSRLSAERRTTTNHQSEVGAYSLARAGMDRYLEVASSAPGASFDTTITGLPGGSVQVSVRRLRAASGGGRAMYVIRAHATHSAATRYDTKTGAAQRSITQFATWEPGTMEVPGAWTALNGFHKNGNSGSFDGADQCTTAPAPLPSVAGVSVPTIAVGGGAGYTGHSGPASGSPPIDYIGADPAAAAATINIDWAGIVASGGSNLGPTVVLTPPFGGMYNDNTWKTVVVNNFNYSTQTALADFTLRNGRGLLVVTGNLTLNMNASSRWEGIILVGGTVTGNGTNTIYGAVISGLNTKLGITGVKTDLGNGTKDIQYNSCFIAQALSGLGGLVAMRNATADNWPVY